MQSKDLEVFDSLPFQFAVKDDEGRYVWVNQAVLQLAQLASKEEIIGKTDRDLIWADDADAIIKIDREVLETGKTANVEEYAAKTAFGSVKTCSCKFAAELDGKKCLFAVVVLMPDENN